MTASATEPEGVLEAAPAEPGAGPGEGGLPFFEGALEDRLMLLRCRSCGTFMSPTGGLGVPLRPRCVRCFAGDLEWAPSTGRGTLYSFALMHQLYDPAFADEIPYNLSIVET